MGFALHMIFFSNINIFQFGGGWFLNQAFFKVMSEWKKKKVFLGKRAILRVSLPPVSKDSLMCLLFPQKCGEAALGVSHLAGKVFAP